MLSCYPDNTLLDLHNITIDYESLTEDKRLQMPNVNAMNL